MKRFEIYKTKRKTSDFIISEIILSSPELPDAFHNLKLVQLSDLHFGVYTRPEVVKKAFEISNNIEPDIILLTGDYIHVGRQVVKAMMFKAIGPTLSRYAQFRRLSRQACMELASLINTLRYKKNIIGIWGNHDYLEGQRTIKNYFQDDIIWLKNQSLDLDIDGEILRISGIDDFRFGTPDIKETTSTFLDIKASILSNKSEPVSKIFLSHNPDTIMLKESNILNDYDLMLCGHTHGGQICLPGSIPIKTETKQRKIVKGLNKFNSLPVYISNGIGCSGIPLRMFCPPEIVIIKYTKS